MKKILFFSALIIGFIVNSASAQYATDPEENTLKINNRNDANYKPGSIQVTPGVKLGAHAGMAFIEDSNGFAIGVFAEIGQGSFSVVPQANYWKIDNTNNFEISGLARLRLSSDRRLEPYVDGGLGVNFYDNGTDNLTKLGIAVGGGIELYGIGENYNLIFDVKYKIIINDSENNGVKTGNISGFILTAGIAFPL